MIEQLDWNRLTNNLNNKEKTFLNNWVNYFSYIDTRIGTLSMFLPHKIIAYFTGNQAMKTSIVARSYVKRILRIHPVPEKNIHDDDVSRVFRFASEILPSDSDSGEIRNTQYPEFKKWLPPFLIKKDISAKRPSMTILDPFGGPDIIVEYVSYNQSTSAVAGVQRKSIWLDEHAPITFYDEQLPRLLATGGDIIYTLTPIQEMLGWEYDHIFLRAGLYVRSDHVRKRYFDRYGITLPAIEKTDSRAQIAVIQAATDDNPTLDPKDIEDSFSEYKDEDIIDIRRYGIFKQISGIVHKDFDKSIHVIDPDKHFPAGLPHDGVHCRAIDYHESLNWAISWIYLSRDDEMFIYDELWISPEKYVTKQIALMVAQKSKDYDYWINIIDPLAEKHQSNTGLSVVDDLNYLFYQYQKEGIGTGGYWRTWDTKSTRGRDIMRERLKNSRICGKPFNNFIRDDRGNVRRVPTVWFTNNCQVSIDFIKNWKKEEWLSREQLVTHDEKDSVQQKWSHFNMCWEGLLKLPEFSTDRYKGSVLPKKENRNRLFVR